jgi:DUF4097 and DUF4098 domain-containing protein YvlB
MKHNLLSGGVLLAGVLAAGCTVTVDSQSQIVREEKRFTVSGVADLRLTTFDGSIQIQSWDKPDIVVEVEKRGSTRESVDALQIVSDQNGSTIELEVKRPRSETFSGVGFYRSASARLIVTVPRNTNLQARSGDGSIRVERVNGRIELRTGDGSIRAMDVVGDLVINTGDGSIAVSGAEGSLDVDTGDGGVNVAGRLNRVRLHTGDGSIVYRAEPESRMAADWTISTGDGGVTVYLPEGFSAVVDAYTGDGTVRSELNVSAEDDEEDRETRRRSLRGRLGEGGRSLRIRTGDGSIRIRPS